MAPARTRARLAAALGPDLVVATRLLEVSVVTFLLMAHAAGGALAFASASVMTLALHAVLKRLNDTRGALARHERLAIIGQTASTVFHQLGRQHGTIGMYAHLLSRGPWPPAVAEHAQRILASVDEANRVVDELLAFGQDRTLNVYPHDLSALLEECAEECRGRAAARAVAMRLPARQPVDVVIDKHKVKQAIGNVLDNAIDASAEGGTIDVDTIVADGVVHVRIRDRGPGVAGEIRARVFTPFATTKADGIGLGLALAKDLIDAHGGAIAWEDADPGTVFVVTLPLHGAVSA
jgi:signal transduction histidine kinase